MPLDCINALEEARSRGIRAWFRWSLPFIPIQTSNLIEMTHELVDLFWIGKLNRNQRQHGHGTRMTYRRLAEVPKRVEALLQKCGRQPGTGYRLKHQLNEAK